MPIPKDFSFDLNLISPIAQCYLEENMVAASIDKMLKYAQYLKHSAFNQQMILMCFRNICEGEKLESFKYFMKDFDETVEQREKGPKLAHLLKKNEHGLGEFSDQKILMRKFPKFG